MTNGIVVVATGHPYYGKLAYNLAVTIKAAEKGMPVVVFHNGKALSHLTEQQASIFDDRIEIVENGVEAKLAVYEKSPFQNTLLCDADTIWLPFRRPEVLFKELAGTKFTAITEGYFDCDLGEAHDINARYLFWADPREVRDAYQLTGKLYQWRSEVMYFEKCDKIETLFLVANSVFKNPLVEVTKFANAVPDEFAINVATCMMKIDPHIYKWQPTFWPYMVEKNVPMYLVRDKHWLYSVGGNKVTSNMRRTYDGIVGQAHKKLRMQHIFMLQSKQSVLKERTFM